MDDLFPRRAFPTFGPCALAPGAPAPPVYAVEAPRAGGLRARVRLECPRRPGVYGMIDAHGELLYVGKAKCLRSRLLSYFRPKSRGDKAGRIVKPARAIVWESQPSEFAALLRELALIRRWRPRFNVQGQPRRGRRSYVCLGRRPAPYVFLAPRPTATAPACFGPVPAGRQAREAVRRVNDWFGLRDCPQAQEMAFADEAELFPQVRTAGCLRYEIGTCLGPCAAACTRPAYAERVRAARAFLAGEDRSPFEVLERDMVAASAALQFERAAALRDRLDGLSWLRDQLERLRLACEEASFVYPVRGQNGRDLWYLIHGGRVVTAVPWPGDDDGRRAAAAALAAVYEKNSVLRLPRPEEMDGVFLVAAWFRRYPAERERVLGPGAALTECLSFREQE